MGLQRQVRANSIQIAWNTFRAVGSVLILCFYSPTIFAFALWQLISNSIYFFFVRYSLWRALSPVASQPHTRFKWQALRGTWRYATGMAGMAAVSTLLTQMDKLAISKMLPLEMLGYYTLAGAMAALPLLLASPIVLAVFPRLTAMVEVKDSRGLIQLYHRTCELIGVAIIPSGLTFALFADDFIFAWTGSADIAQRTGLVASLLLIAQLMQAIALVQYYTALAHGEVKLYLYIAIASAIFVAPLLLFLVFNFGIIGAGLSWLVMSLSMLLCGVYLFHRSFLPCELRRWCLRGVGYPVFASLPCVLLCRFFLPPTPSRLLTLFLIMLVAVGSSTVAATTIPELRSVIVKKTRRLFGACHGAI
jgi:O-antigen/teichoic acid export membrane protein